MRMQTYVNLKNQSSGAAAKWMPGAIVLVASLLMGGCNLFNIFGGGGPPKGIDAAIAIMHSGSNFTSGQDGVYTIAVTDAGTLPTTGVITVSDSLPTGLTFVSAVGAGWICTGGQVVTCTNPGPIASGGSAGAITLTVLVTSGATASLQNTATVTAAGDVNAANNTSTDTVSVIAGTPTIDLAITLTHNAVPFVLATNESYTIALQNVGNTSTTGIITVADTLPTGLTFVSGTGTGWNCNAAGQAVTCANAGPIAAQASAGNITLTVAVAANAPASITDTATVATNGEDNAANDTSTDVVSTGAAITNGCGALLGNESMLNGQFAILMRGFQGGGNGTPIALAGSFTANGSGVITNGEEDINNATAETHFTIQQQGSFYTLGSDFRGCVQLTNDLGTTNVYRIAVEVGGLGVTTQTVSQGKIIEDDDAIGDGSGKLARMTGILQVQAPASFSIGALSARYAFGMEGVDSNSGHIGNAGTFNVSNDSGAISSGLFDSNDAGALLSGVTGAVGAITIPAGAPNGRGTFSYLFSSGGTDFEFTAAIYIVNASEFFIVDTDPFSTVHAITSGRAIATGSAFTAASLQGNFIVHASGSNLTGGVQVGSSTLGLLTFVANTSGNLDAGTVNGSLNQFSSGSTGGLVNQVVSGGTYTVDPASGRVVLVIPGQALPPVLYLVAVTGSADQFGAFVAGTDASAILGGAENQPAATYSITSVTTPVGLESFFGNEGEPDNTVTNTVGSVVVNAGGTTVSDINQSGPTGLQAGFADGTIAINANGTGNVGAKTFVITNGTKFFILDGSGGAATITVVERQPAG